MGAGFGNPAGNQVAALLEGAAQPRRKECSRFFRCRGANPPQRAASDKTEFSRRIAEGQFQFFVSGEGTRILARKVRGPIHGFGESSPCAMADRSSVSGLVTSSEWKRE